MRQDNIRGTVGTTSSGPPAATGEKRRRMGGMEKDLCCYLAVEKQLQFFLSFDHFAKLELL